MTKRGPRSNMNRGRNGPSPSAQNRHHLGWERRQWEKNNILYKLREYPGMIIMMNLRDHNELHRELLPPPKPTNQQAEELLSTFGKYDSQTERTDYLDLAVRQLQDTNPRYAGHLLLQRGFVLLHPVNQLERDMVDMQHDLSGRDVAYEETNESAVYRGHIQPDAA